MLDLNIYIDNYCERIDPGLLGEPLNAISNITFFIAAYYLGKSLALQEREASEADIQSRYLINLVWFIGFGSLTFHVFATIWSGILDIFPIALLILYYSYFSLRRFFLINKYISYLAPLVIIFITLILSKIGNVTNSAYFAALSGIILIGSISLFYRQKKILFGMLLAAFIFSISLTLRIFDEILCSNIIIGTHWIWHILNSLTLYIIIKIFIENKPHITKF